MAHGSKVKGKQKDEEVQSDSGELIFYEKSHYIDHATCHDDIHFRRQFLSFLGSRFY